jgi:hypothetical protein
MADITSMTTAQRKEAIKKCKVIEFRVLVLPEKEEDMAEALQAVAQEHGVFLVSSFCPLLDEGDILEAVENWGQVAQVVETLVED